MTLTCLATLHQRHQAYDMPRVLCEQILIRTEQVHGSCNAYTPTLLTILAELHQTQGRMQPPARFSNARWRSRSKWRE